MRHSMTNNLFETVCGPLFKKSHHGNSVFSSYASPHSKSDNKWFNDDCRDAREEIYRCLNLFRNYKSDIDCKNMTRARSLFKSNLRNAKSHMPSSKLANWKI